MSDDVDLAARRACEQIIGAQITDEYAQKIDQWFAEQWYLYYEPEGKDMEMYAAIEFVIHAFHCWHFYSKHSVRKAVKWFGQYAPGVQSILDVGAGIGATTAQLAQDMPDRSLYYANLEGWQWDASASLFSMLDLPNLSMVRDELSVAADAVIAMEYMEHFKDPITESRRLLSNPRVQVYFDASSFTIKSAGHWSHYMVDGYQVEPTRIRRLFNTALREMGFVPAQNVIPDCRSFWNNLPAVWVRPQYFPKQQGES
jgi:hypothetical protein